MIHLIDLLCLHFQHWRGSVALWRIQYCAYRFPIHMYSESHLRHWRVQIYCTAGFMAGGLRHRWALTFVVVVYQGRSIIQEWVLGSPELLCQSCGLRISVKSCNWRLHGVEGRIPVWGTIYKIWNGYCSFFKSFQSLGPIFKCRYLWLSMPDRTKCCRTCQPVHLFIFVFVISCPGWYSSIW